MKAALVVALLLSLTVLSRQRLAVWHDERTLWLSAWETQPTARAALNLSLLSLKAQRFDEVDLWTQAAMFLDSGPQTRRVVQAQLRLASAMDWDACARPPWASWC